MLLVIDNYDSFTYNLVQYFGELGAKIEVRRNDEVSVEEIENRLKPERILISPGPGTPDDAGISLAVIERFAEKIPILGVCLGHQAIGQFFGGKVARAPVPVELSPGPHERLPGTVESATYFVVSEALANVAKYARATHATVAVRRVNGSVTVDICDDGVGGADANHGSGLRGLADRVAALDGTLAVDSPAGHGTRLHAEIPCAPG